MRRLFVLLFAACGSSSAPPPELDAPVSPSIDAPVAKPKQSLEVKSLGVQGFELKLGDDIVLTAPLFTRQSTIEVGLNLPIEVDTAAVDAGLAGIPLDKVRAIVSGHAHYDHLLDVTRVMEKAPGATLYANRTAKHIFAALAPDTCGPAPSPTIDRTRVVAMDDPAASYVDWTNCPSQKPPGAPVEGTWVTAPGGHVRMKAFCSMHPDQIGPIHFAPGSIDVDQCKLPSAASQWLEGSTLAILIDFLDDAGKPTFRVFYQDAPTDAPVGHVPPAVLAEHPVDLALLCVGSYNAVADHPTSILANIQPRYAISGHWEDFFQAASEPPQPIPLLDLPTYMMRADAAMAGAPDGAFTVGGAAAMSRHVLAQPGMKLVVPPEQ